MLCFRDAVSVQPATSHTLSAVMHCKGHDDPSAGNIIKEFS
jgi:hypothetical protein